MLLSLVLSFVLTALARVQAANGERVKFLAAGKALLWLYWAFLAAGL